MNESQEPLEDFTNAEAMLLWIKLCKIRETRWSKSSFFETHRQGLAARSWVNRFRPLSRRGKPYKRFAKGAYHGNKNQW